MTQNLLKSFCMRIYGDPTHVLGNCLVLPGQTIRTAPDALLFVPLPTTTYNFIYFLLINLMWRRRGKR